MTRSIYKRIALGLEGMNIPAYVGIFVALKLMLTYLSNLINFSATKEPIASGFFEFRNTYEALVTIVVVAPLVETYLIQYLFFKPYWSSSSMGNYRVVGARIRFDAPL